jgi:hypothetical protein
MQNQMVKSEPRARTDIDAFLTSDHGDEGRWNGKADSSDETGTMDHTYGAADDAAEFGPEDQIEPTAEKIDAMRAPKAMESIDTPRYPAKTKTAAHRIIDEAVDLAPERPVEASRQSMASFETMAALSKLGQTHGAAARFDAYLALLDPGEREAVLKFMLDAKWQPSDPEVRIAMLMGHLRAIAQTIPASIDAAAIDFEQRQQASLAAFADVPDQIEEALGRARVAAEETAKIVRSEADGFQTHLGDALRDAIMGASEMANKAVVAEKKLALAEIEQSRAQSRQENENMKKSAEQALGAIALKAAADIVAMVAAKQKVRNPSESASEWMWRAAACGLGGIVMGVAFMALAHGRGWY